MDAGQCAVESLDLMRGKPFGGVFEGARVLVTGHTGFKGSWLCLWLQALGADVTGVALPPQTITNHWDLLNLPITDMRQDIRDADPLRELFATVRPTIVLHLAAQALVRESYKDPLTNWATNVMGTVNVLEACRHTPAVRAVLIVTTDKCYENIHVARGYKETDRLGGHDPYSASKAAAELVAASYRQSFFTGSGAPLVATARAGNVIGGGDWSPDRLIPDLARAMQAGQPLRIRSPHATRPWQHVLEALSGYLLLTQRLVEGDHACARAWNFGPDDDGNRTVETVLQRLQTGWDGARWEIDAGPQPHEAELLHLDSILAREVLGWSPIWSLDEGLDATAQWYQAWQRDRTVLSREQLAAFTARAQAKNISWMDAA